MDHYEVVKYSIEFYSEWNDFVLNSKNGTFLFHRDFMEYHQDRFQDNSYMVYDNHKLVALFPANIKGNTIYSHQGLTYGGLILNYSIKIAGVIQIFKKLLKIFKDNGIEIVEVKFMPSIYNKIPSDELFYLMSKINAKLVRRELFSVINLGEPANFTKSRLEGYKRGIKKQLEISEVNSFREFWNQILIPNLDFRHKSKPVHNLNEIEDLKIKFPKNIRQFNVYFKNTIVAGATIFETDNVARLQYISGNIDKNILGSLDYLQIYLIKEVFKDKKYFDLGTSRENSLISQGLLFWKEGFGARSLTSDVCSISTKNYKLLNHILV
jgi:hypothetical protein